MAKRVSRRVQFTVDSMRMSQSVEYWLRANGSTAVGNKKHLFFQIPNRSWDPLGFQLKGQG
jgi:hypothetical protein